MGFSFSLRRKRAAAHLAHAYQPIIRGYFGVAALYYGLMTPLHVITLAGTPLFAMASVSTLACLFALYYCRALINPQPVRKLELVTSLVNLLVLANVLIALRIEYNQEELTYFIMMAMVFAFASVSMRQAFASIAAAMCGLFMHLAINAPQQFLIYAFVAFAGALSSISIAYFLRRAIDLAVTERQEADRARESAEVRLSSAEALSEEMRRQSLTDSLTGLPNRRAFFEVLKDYRASMAENDELWLVLLDLDGFKAVNDNYGHLMGDELLRKVAGRLRDYADGDAFLCRMGGDEFNLILSSNGSKEEVEEWCQQMLGQTAETYLIEDRLIQISGSTGCYQLAAGESDAKLLQKADYALMHAKRNGKNRCVMFRDEHEKDAAERFNIEQALRVADFRKEIDLRFQPQFDLAQNRIICVEALARLDSPAIGYVGPTKFIQIAEESGLIARITVAVVEKALAALTAWEHQVPISVNLSGHDLISDQIIDEIIALVASSDVSPKMLEFEVTETAMMSDTQRASANLLRLAGLGHPIALDDFGTGYSNFNYLRTLPIGKLKVDRAFMENLTDPMTEKVLHSLAGMARTLDVQCLLEGIESELELVMAKRVGAQAVQGFLFGRPMTSSQLQESVASHNLAPQAEAPARLA